MAAKRNLIIISGYYGFSNLGDEAILESLVNALAALVPRQDIVVLSANPQSTAQAYGVQALHRSRFGEIWAALRQAQLLVSGGGGLFQDTRSAGSALFYATHIALARAAGARVAFFAQGLGPLRSEAAKLATLCALKLSHDITLRDRQSVELAASWHIPATLTADPVWCLPSSDPPANVEAIVSTLIADRSTHKPLVGLSLRPFANFTGIHERALISSLSQGLPAQCHLLLLPLQPDSDRACLERFAAAWRAQGGHCTMFPSDKLTLPSQWIPVLSKLDMLVSMRLHAAIMALCCSIPTIGIAYDPKVVKVLTDFEQPILILAKDEDPTSQWTGLITESYARRSELSAKASGHLQAAKNLACQNFNLLSRILGMQSAL